MTNLGDHNAAIWKSAEGVQEWVAGAGDRETKRATQWHFMAELLRYGQDEPFRFLDLGAGTGAAARAVLDLYPKATAVLADFSAEMMEQGAAFMAPYEGRYSFVEFDMNTGDWPDAIGSALDAVVTSQCIHHLPDARKKSLFAEIKEHLVPGGWYVNYDPVNAPDALVDEVWTRVNALEDPEAAEQARHRSAREEERHANHVRYMIPLEPQVALLREAGFEAVDVYWKRLDYAIYGGRRPLG